MGSTCSRARCLFDLSADPHEEHDLAPQRPDICREASWLLSEWHDQQMAKMPNTDKVDPLWTVMAEGGPFHAKHVGADSPLPKYIIRLEATGRADGAAELKKRWMA